MTVIIIIAVVGLLIYLGTRKKSEPTFVDKKQGSQTSKTSSQTSSTRHKFQSKISDLPFPDRIDAIVWHIKAIDKGLSSGDLELANLSYAKLIESIRQQNVTEKGSFEEHLKTIRKEYEEFRTFYGLEYPQQFLPPSERKKKEPTQSSTSQDNTLVFLETLNFEELPKSVIKHIDIVRTVSQWNELGFKPKKDQYGRWNDIKRQERYFEFIAASATNPRHKLSLETGKRITSKPYFIKALVEQGIPLEDFVDNGDDLKHFIKADDLFNEKSYEEALKEIELAISIRATSDYKELKKDIQVKLGNEDVVDQLFKKHEFDIDSPIHTGEIFDWFKALLKNNKIDKVVSYIQKTNETLDKLAKGEIKSKIYGQQSGDWYSYKKEDFNKNLFRIFDFSALQIEQTDETLKMLDLFIKLYIGKEIKPIESIADIYVQWQLKDKALELYKLCLDKLAGEEKPRVKARLTKKINELTD
jgi:tetratricopeptide (TPR) repeat protein